MSTPPTMGPLPDPRLEALAASTIIKEGGQSTYASTQAQFALIYRLH